MMDIAKLRELAEKATPGPWEAYTDCPGECCWLIRQPEDDDTFASEGVTWPEASREDAAYIAAASPDVMRRLLDQVDTAREALLNAVNWHQNDKWRYSKDKANREAWALHDEDLRSALQALDPEKDKR